MSEPARYEAGIYLNKSETHYVIYVYRDGSAPATLAEARLDKRPYRHATATTRWGARRVARRLVKHWAETGDERPILERISHYA